MTPKDKARELVDKFSPYVDSEIAGEEDFEYSYEEKLRNAKSCANICVIEIKAALIENGKENDSLQNMDSELRYWGNVLKEIDLL